MNYLSREKAKELIPAHGLSKFFIKVIEEKLDSPLDIYFGCPTLYYLNEKEQEAYELGDILPLWEDTGGYMQYAYDINEQDYIGFDIEDGEVSRYSWDELIRSIIDTLIEHEYEYDEHESLEKVIMAVKEQLIDLNVENFDEIARNIQSEWGNS